MWCARTLRPPSGSSSGARASGPPGVRRCGFARNPPSTSYGATCGPEARAPEDHAGLLYHTFATTLPDGARAGRAGEGGEAAGGGPREVVGQPRGGLLGVPAGGGVEADGGGVGEQPGPSDLLPHAGFQIDP